MQTCAHCHKPIGQLEPVYAWNDRVICADCQRTLTERSAEPTRVVIERPRVQLIERTGKFWKLQIALALTLMLVGLWMTGLGLYRLVYPPVVTGWITLGAIITAISVIWLLIARTGAWWEHG